MDADENLGKLSPEKRGDLRRSVGLVEGNLELSFKTTLAIDILNAFASYTLEALDDKIAAVKPKYDALLAAAAKELEPKLQTCHVPSAILKTDTDVDAWIAEASKKVKAMLSAGPVQVL